MWNTVERAGGSRWYFNQETYPGARDLFCDTVDLTGRGYRVTFNTTTPPTDRPEIETFFLVCWTAPKIR